MVTSRRSKLHLVLSTGLIVTALLVQTTTAQDGGAAADTGSGSGTSMDGQDASNAMGSGDNGVGGGQQDPTPTPDPTSSPTINMDTNEGNQDAPTVNSNGDVGINGGMTAATTNDNSTISGTTTDGDTTPSTNNNATTSLADTLPEPAQQFADDPTKNATALPLDTQPTPPGNTTINLSGEAEQATQALPQTVVIDNQAKNVSSIINNDFASALTSKILSKVEDVATDLGVIFKQATSSQSTVEFYKQTGKQVFSTYTDTNAVLLQFQAFNKVGGDALLGFQKTLSYGCLYPKNFPAIKPFLVQVGLQCTTSTVITQTFVLSYLSLSPSDRRLFLSTVSQVSTVTSCMNSYTVVPLQTKLPVG